MNGTQRFADGAVGTAFGINQRRLALGLRQRTGDATGDAGTAARANCCIDEGRPLAGVQCQTFLNPFRFSLNQAQQAVIDLDQVGEEENELERGDES